MCGSHPMEAVTFFSTYVDEDGALHTVVTPGDPADEGITWVRGGQRCADDPEILALFAARALQSRVWTTADAREIPVHEMHNAHIVNVITKFRYRFHTPDRLAQLKAVIAEAKRRNLEVP